MKTKYQKKTRERRRKQSFRFLPLDLRWLKKLEVTSVFKLREKKTNHEQISMDLQSYFSSSLTEQSKVPATSLLPESYIWGILPKKASEDSSVLGITGIKSPNPALPSDPFLKSVLNTFNLYHFIAEKVYGFPYPASSLFSLLLGNSSW